MKISKSVRSSGRGFEVRLAGYLAASGAVGGVLASEAQAVIVSNTTVQPFGINGAVPIDFDSDGQVDFEIDHDRVDLGGGNLVDYLQVDKNDTNGASLGENPFPINEFDTFTVGIPALPNDTATAAYAITGPQGSYPAALSHGNLIGAGSTWDFQETADFFGTGRTIRANRLIDEDAGDVDMILGGLTASQVAVPTNSPQFLGLGGNVRYLGMRMEFASNDLTNYGWIGIRITNEADATGEVVGWAYETTPGTSIRAGQVPEPSALLTGIGGLFIAGCMMWRRLFGRR